MTQTVVENILEHYGTKGMKWGVRKTGAAKSRLTKEPYHKEYTGARRRADRDKFGKRGVNRINNKLRAGKLYDEARSSETKRRQVATRVKAGAVIAAYLLASFGPEVAVSTRDARQDIKRNIANRAETNRGRRHAADHYGLGQNDDIQAKQRRDGTYNVTSM